MIIPAGTLTAGATIRFETVIRVRVPPRGYVAAGSKGYAFHVDVIKRAIRMADGRFDRVLAEPETPERAAKLCNIETKRTALAKLIGAC